MEPEYSNKRKEVPFLIEVRATVKASKNGQTIRATTVNMSGCGVFSNSTNRFCSQWGIR